MNDRLKKHLDEVAKIHQQLDAVKNDSFAKKLAAASFATHLDEIQKISLLEGKNEGLELLDLRLKAPIFHNGSIPLRLLTRVADDLQGMISYAALRLIEGGKRKRIPDELNDRLNLRLAGLYQGSCRLLVSATGDRDLFTQGLAERAINRVFKLLNSEQNDNAFLEAVTDLGPASVKKIRNFFSLLKANSAELEVTWSYQGTKVIEWIGSESKISSITDALQHADVKSTDEICIHGKIDLLSTHERLHLKTSEGIIIKILFPESLFNEVKALHLDQQVSLNCTLTEILNPHTNELTSFYELTGIQSIKR